MKILIVYYSRTGKNKKLALELATKIKADTEELIDRANRNGLLGYLRGGRDAWRKKETSLKSLEKNPADYDLVIFMSPLWAAVMAPAVRTYVKQNLGKIKQAALISISGGGECNFNKKAPLDFRVAVNRPEAPVLLLSEKEIENTVTQNKINTFIKSLNLSLI